MFSLFFKARTLDSVHYFSDFLQKILRGIGFLPPFYIKGGWVWGWVYIPTGFLGVVVKKRENGWGFFVMGWAEQYVYKIGVPLRVKGGRGRVGVDCAEKNQADGR